MLMIGFIRKDPAASLNFIMHYNVPLFLLESIDWKVVRSLLLMICSSNSFQGAAIQQELQDRFWRYLKYTGFFVDIGRKLFSNAPVPKEKLTVDYKPFGGNLINLATSNGNENGISLKFEEDEQNNEGNLYTLSEDRRGLKSDIDQIKELLLKKRKFKSLKAVAMSITSQNRGIHAWRAVKSSGKGAAFKVIRAPRYADQKKTTKPREETKETGESSDLKGSQRGISTKGNMNILNTSENLGMSSVQSSTVFSQGKKGSKEKKPLVGRNTLLLIPQLQAFVNLAALDELYPNSIKTHSKGSLLNESKNSKNSLETFFENDETSLAVCDFLSDLLGDIIMSYDQNPWKETLGLQEKNIVFLLTAMFEDSECELFTLLIRNYLLKINLAFSRSGSSAEASGTLVNLLLEFS